MMTPSLCPYPWTTGMPNRVAERLDVGRRRLRTERELHAVLAVQ